MTRYNIISNLWLIDKHLPAMKYLPVFCTMKSGAFLFRSLLVRLLVMSWNRIDMVGTPFKVKLCVGQMIHRIYLSYQHRYVSEYTRFFRNPCQLEVLTHLVLPLGRNSSLRLAVIGCSTGAELYSALWAIRSARPDLAIESVGLDISPTAIRTAREAVYAVDGQEMKDVADDIRNAMFEDAKGFLRVKDHVRGGATLIVGDALDPNLPLELGLQDIVFCNNVLIHLSDPLAEACLLNLARLVVPGGHIFVWGVDLKLKTRIMNSLGMEPVMLNLESVHNADARAREVWPLQWWGLEPLDKGRPDWKIRYCTVFRKPMN